MKGCRGFLVRLRESCLRHVNFDDDENWCGSALHPGQGEVRCRQLLRTKNGQNGPPERGSARNRARWERASAAEAEISFPFLNGKEAARLARA